MQNTKKILFLALTILILSILIGYYLYSEKQKKDANIKLNNSGYEKLVGDLSSEANQEDVNRIFTNWRDRSENQGSLKTILQLKAISLNEDNSPEARADSFDGMLSIFYNIGDQDVLNLIFEGDFMNKFVVKGDNEKTIKNLFEYIETLHPSANTYLRIANWYANAALDSKTSTDDIKIYTLKAKEYFQKGQAAIKNIPNNPRLTASPLNWEAVVIGKLYNLKQTKEDPEKYFKVALESSITGQKTPNQEGFTTYRYAAFLANTYGNSRSEDIKKLLNKFYKDNSKFSGTNITYFFKAQKNGVLPEATKDLTTLATIDSDFKTYLTNLGWIF